MRSRSRYSCKDSPVDGSSYYSLNGDINVWLAGDLDAEVFFESYNGDLYLDSDRIQAMPTQVVKEKKAAGKGIKKSITARQGIQVGRGGPKLDFETFNGDVYLRKQ